METKMTIDLTEFSKLDRVKIYLLTRNICNTGSTYTCICET